jgi:hypothetical protein
MSKSNITIWTYYIYMYTIVYIIKTWMMFIGCWTLKKNLSKYIYIIIYTWVCLKICYPSIHWFIPSFAPAARSLQTKVVPCCGHAPGTAQKRCVFFAAGSPLKNAWMWMVCGIWWLCDKTLIRPILSPFSWERRSVRVHSWGDESGPYRAFQTRDERKSKWTSKL